ncbi:MAG: HAD family hydrolase [Chloroflexaceae bacterium]|jgi:HAD superfamily hydrolase (TIGR01509 family)|nr:HAD family hydrolase [Chloroflexaceae bacterium]
MITALILDFDGLMVDTETPAFESWRMLYAEHGQELSLELWQHALGTNSGFDAMAHLVSLLAKGDTQNAPIFNRQSPIADLYARRQALKQQLCENQPLLPGVLELLDQADELGLPCAVASSSGREWVEGWLRRHGVYERFVCIRTANDVAHTKPAPDLFLSAAAGMQRQPGACLVFEDSPNGIRAAQAAGMRCVAVPGAISGQLQLPPTDLVLPALNAMPLAEILAHVTTSFHCAKACGIM